MRGKGNPSKVWVEVRQEHQEAEWMEGQGVKLSCTGVWEGGIMERRGEAVAGPHSWGMGGEGVVLQGGPCCCGVLLGAVLLVWVSKLQLQFPQPRGFCLLALRQATGPGCPTDAPHTREIPPVLFTATGTTNTARFSAGALPHRMLFSAIAVLFFSPNS